MSPETESNTTLEHSTHWNYRIMKADDGQGYSIHECYWDERGRLEGWSGDIAPFGETPENLRRVLKMMADGAENAEVTDPTIGKGPQ